MPRLTTVGTINLNYAVDISFPSAAHLNSGTISVNESQTLSQVGTTPSFSNTGAITISSGKTFSINSGTFNHNSGSVLQGGGTFDLNNASLNLNSDLSNNNINLAFGGCTNQTAPAD